MKKDLPKQTLYESVKALLEVDDPHVHLPQQKLFTLFSIAFQYLLYNSTKKPGSYIIRVEDTSLAEKLARKSKDPSTRRFMHSLLVPRKLKYGNSIFYLDFFNMSSWNLTRILPKERVQAALVIKNTGSKPMTEILVEGDMTLAESNLPENYYFSTLQDFVPKTITIAHDITLEGTAPLLFDFIKKERERALAGVTISRDIDLDEIDES